MPEISTFIDTVDEQTAISFIFATGGRLIASRHSHAQYTEITKWDEYLSTRVDERLYFIVYDCYMTCPLTMHKISGGYYGGTYSIDQRIGGPTIDFLASVQIEQAGKHLVNHGILAYYNTYQDPRTGEMHDAPELLVMQYKAIIKELRKGGKVIRGNSGRRYLIGRHTYQSVKEGRLYLGVPELHLD